MKHSSFSGFGGRPPEEPTRVARRFVLHGQDIHRHLLPGDVRQVVGARIPQVLHQRVVLARLCHRHGKLQYKLIQTNQCLIASISPSFL